ncbi:MAG: FHA domain-containing serine/threonine-protein kinase [Acetatifactor sp.]
MSDMELKLQEPLFALPMDTIIHGRYLVGRVLGVGGFGITYQGQDLNSGAFVAIKEYFPNGMVTRTPGTTVVEKANKYEMFEKGKAKFLQEARIIYHFQNEHILSIYSLFEENRTAYYVMEFLEGKDLKQYLQSKGGKIKWSELKYIVFQIMDALECIHKEGIIHRDISPDNIYLCSDNNAKLIDFGTARNVNEEKTCSIIIKKGYAPPEQYMTSGKQGAFTDIYALGGTIYRALTGKVPTDALERVHGEIISTIKQLEPDAPEYVSKAVAKAMSLDESERFQSVIEFKEALKEPNLTPKKFFKFSKSNITESISEYIHTWAKIEPRLVGLSGFYAGQEFKLDQDVIFGRDAARCNVIFPVNAIGISKVHCQICLDVNGYRAIVDCDSTFGTYLNGVKLYPGRLAVLQSGSEIRLGDREVFRFNF